MAQNWHFCLCHRYELIASLCFIMLYFQTAPYNFPPASFWFREGKQSDFMCESVLFWIYWSQLRYMWIINGLNEMPSLNSHLYNLNPHIYVRYLYKHNLVHVMQFFGNWIELLVWSSKLEDSFLPQYCWKFKALQKPL